MTTLWFNKWLEPTAVTAGSSSIAVYATSRRWLGFLNQSIFDLAQFASMSYDLSSLIAKGIARSQAGSLLIVASDVQGSTAGNKLSRPTSASTNCGANRFLRIYHAEALCHLLQERVRETRQCFHRTVCDAIHFRSICARLKRWSRLGHLEVNNWSVTHRVCSRSGAHSFISAMWPNKPPVPAIAAPSISDESGCPKAGSESTSASGGDDSTLDR